MSESPRQGSKSSHPDRSAETLIFWVPEAEWAALPASPLFASETPETREQGVLIKLAGNSRIRLELRSDTLEAEGSRLDIRTLHLARLSGRRSDFWRLATQLATSHRLIPFDAVGEVIGERFMAGLEQHPQKFTSAPLSGADTPADVFTALAAQGLRCWQINLRGALAYGDPEFFHQLRVTLRRMGTLLKLFKPILPSEFQLHWKMALKDIARQCEDIRDLDVMLESILAPMLTDDAGAPTPRATARKATRQAIQRCQAARQQALETFLGQRHGAALLAFAKDLGALEIDTGKKSRLPIVAFTERRVEKIYARSVEKLNATRKGVTAESGHALRISLKHLRYACEFFAPLFDEHAMHKYAKQISLLQDELGAAHDLHVAIERLQALAEGSPAMKGIGEIAGEWHGGARLPPLKQVVARVEDQLTTCLPWCGECKRRHSGKYHRQEA